MPAPPAPPVPLRIAALARLVRCLVVGAPLACAFVSLVPSTVGWIAGPALVFAIVAALVPRARLASARLDARGAVVVWAHGEATPVRLHEVRTSVAVEDEVHVTLEPQRATSGWRGEERAVPQGPARGLGGVASRGLGGAAFRRSVGAAFRGFGGAAFRGFGGAAFRGFGGAAFRGFGGAVLRRSVGAAFRGFGGAAFRRSVGAAFRGFGGAAFRRSGGASLVLRCADAWSAQRLARRIDAARALARGGPYRSAATHDLDAP